MYPIIENRDIPFQSLMTDLSLSTTERRWTDDIHMSCDGTVHPHEVQKWVWQDTSFTAERTRAAGVYVVQPAVEYETYMLHWTAGTDKKNIIPYLFWGAGPVSPTSPNSGDTIKFAQPIQTGAGNSDFSWGRYEGAIAIKPFGEISSIDYSARPLAFGMAFYSKAANASAKVWGMLAVQRLAGRPPTMVDRRIQ